jgi:general secretion pathway protein G
MKPLKHYRRGFTIVELLVVIVVIGILASIVIVAYNGVQSKARDNIRKQDLQTISKAVELFYADNGRYPMYGGWCTQMSNPSYSASFQAAIEKYLPSVPKDPLYKETYQDYFYQNINGQSYRLFAELEESDVAEDGIGGCARTSGINNEYDYRIPSY